MDKANWKVDEVSRNVGRKIAEDEPRGSLVVHVSPWMSRLTTTKSWIRTDDQGEV